MIITQAAAIAGYPFNASPTVPFACSAELDAAMLDSRYPTNNAFLTTLNARLAITDRTTWAAGDSTLATVTTVTPYIRATKAKSGHEEAVSA